MQTLGTTSRYAILPENQRMALISLLGDEDPDVYRIVRNKLLSYGESAADWLRPYALSDDPRLRRRAIEILHYQAKARADKRFLEFCRTNGEDLDLETGVGLLAQTKYPEINREGYAALFDDWVGKLRGRLGPRMGADEILSIVNHFVFQELGFHGNEQYGLSADCSYINRVVDTREGNPIGLCAIYLFLARRLRLPVTGVGLPGHFVCRYQSSTVEIYIDCFRKGMLLTKGDCIKYMQQASYGLADNRLSPIRSRRMLVRICNNLLITYSHLELTEEAARVKRYLNMLAR